MRKVSINILYKNIVLGVVFHCCIDKTMCIEMSIKLGRVAMTPGLSIGNYQICQRFLLRWRSLWPARSSLNF